MIAFQSVQLIRRRLRLRKISKPKPAQRKICNTLSVHPRPGGVRKALV